MRSARALFSMALRKRHITTSRLKSPSSTGNGLCPLFSVLSILFEDFSKHVSHAKYGFLAFAAIMIGIYGVRGAACSFDESPNVVVDGDDEIIRVVKTVVHVLDHSHP